MELTLKRVSMTDDGVIGVLLSGVYPVCLTFEEEWKNNAKGISSIPAGSYLCQKFKRPNGLDTYQVMDVPGNRTLILFHPGNTEIDTEGCILPAMEWGYMEAIDDDTGVKELQLAGLRSGEAFKKFMEVVNGKETFTLHIKWC